MTNWRKAATVTASLTMVAALGACGSSAADSTTPAKSSAAPTSAAPASGEVTFWSFVKGSDAVAKAFNDSHPNITVKFETQAGGPDYYAKLSNAVKSGAVPDAAVAEYTRLPELVSLGAATDLTDTAGALVRDTFPESIQSLVNLGDKTWGIPRDAAPMMYYYRKDFFDANGLTPAKTWDEFKSLAGKVKAADANARAGAFLTGDANLLTDLSWQAGAKWFGTKGNAWTVDIDSAPSKKVADYWQGLVKDDLVKTYPMYADEFWQGVQKNEVMGYVCASWCAGGLKATVKDQSGKWAVAELPSWDGKSASAMWGGSSFIVPKGAKNPAAAAEFIKWITTDPTGIAAWYGTGASSMYPASPKLVDVAKKSFNTDFYGGQDIFAIGTKAYESVPAGWSWGPAMSATDKAIIDRLGVLTSGGSLSATLAEVQADSTKAMTARGLTVGK